MDQQESNEQSEINKGYEVGSHTVQMLHKYFEIDATTYFDEWIPIADIISTLELHGVKGSQRMIMMDISSELLRNGCERSNSNPTTGNGRLTCYNGVLEKQTQKKSAWNP